MKTSISILFLLLLGVSFSQDVAKDSVPILTKKEKRIQKRYIHPKSVFFQLTTGGTINQLKFSEKDPFFKRRTHLVNVFNFSAKAEVGTQNDFFYEVGMSLREYRYGFHSTKFAFYLGPYSYFGALKLHGGYGKRIVLNKSNLNFFNISAGVSLNYNLNHEYDLINLSGSPINNPVDMGDYTAKQYSATSPHKIFPTLYIGLSKDIRIYRGFYFTIDYQYNQGLISTISQRVEYYKNSNPSEITTVYNHFRGTSHAFSIGLKQRFLAKKYRKNPLKED